MRIDGLDPIANKELLREPKTPTAPALTPQQVSRLTEIKTRAGWVPPDQQLVLARSGATDDAVDAVANLNAKQIVDLQASEPDEGSWLRRNVYSRVKAASRWSMAGLNFVPEFVQGGVAQVFDEGTDTDGWFISTSLGTMIENPELRGEGFFLGEKGMEKQAERARRYRGTVNGSAWTVGRGAANLVFKPNTKPYSVMSGVLDILTMIKTDPTGPLVKGVKYLTKGGYTVPLIADDAARTLRAGLESESGITRGLAETVLDGTKFDAFTRTNGRMVRLIDRLVEEKNPLRIAEDIFDHKIPNELSVALAKANNADEVRGLLATGWSIGRGALPEDIRLIQGGRIKTAIGDLVVERMPLVDGIRKSRFFTKMETGTIVTHGTQQDNQQAVKSLVAYMRTAGVDNETIGTIANKALQAFTPMESDTARYKVMQTFEDALKSVMRKDGIRDESIDLLFKRGKNAVDKLRGFLIDRGGYATDNGYSSYLLNKNREFIADEAIDTLLKDLSVPDARGLAIVSPTELVELLDRVVILPDLREVRRFTRNPLFRPLLEGNIDKLPLTAKRKPVAIEVITDPKRYDEIVAEIKTLDSTLDAPRIDSLKQELAGLKRKEIRRIITPDQRAALAAIEYTQNQLWKPLALATGGYMVRNSLDAQVRMAFSDLPSLVTHPFEYLNLVLGSSKKMTLRLENIANVRRPVKPGEIIPEGVVTVDELVDDVREAMTFGMRQQGLYEFDSHGKAIGSFTSVSREMPNGLKLHTDGIVQQGRRSVNDTLRKVANQTFVEYGGITTQTRDVAVNRIVNTILKNAKLKKAIDDLHEAGFSIVNPQTGKAVKMPPVVVRELAEDEAKQLYRQYAYRIVVDNQQLMTGGIPEMNFMHAFGYTPITEGGRMTGAFDEMVDDLVSLAEDGSKKVGSVVQLGDNRIGIITRVRDAATGEVVIDPFDGTVVSLEGRLATVQPVHPERSFDGVFGDRRARKLIEGFPTTDETGVQGLPRTTKRELMAGDPNDRDALKNIRDSYDRGVNWFFGELGRFSYGTINRRLERSPVFREFYYRAVGDHIDRLRPEDAQRFLDDVTVAAKEAGVSAEKYVGSKDLIRRMRETAKTGGDVALEELDDYAKFRALTETKELLYDASSRSNLEDVLRVIMPFAPAWKEILGTYIGFLKTNPIGTSRSFQRVYQGVGQADPDNDGRGFFYKDPQTGEMMFTFPGSGTLSKLFTGLDATLEAPTKRLSQGIQAFPALGPMAQVAASQILPHLPEADFLTGLFLPYGSKGPLTAFNPTPQWLNKLSQVITAPERNLETVYANTYIEVARALSASGDYDLSSKDDLRQLEEDARFKARILTGFRAASQFFGPTAGSTEFNIPTKDGDVYVGELMKAFYDMQADPQVGYDGAVQKFLNTFGDEAAIYVASKTQSVAEGLESTKQFQDWAENNDGLIKDYETVARYFAPAGSDFDFAVWNLQVQSGERVRLAFPQIVELAQRRIGSSLYADARRQVGPYPSEDARAALKQYRSFLHTKYPGFPANAEFTVGEFYNDVLQLKDLVSDSRISGNDTATAVRTYLSARDEAIARSGVSEQGFKTAKSAEKYRAGLETIAFTLIDKYPNFARIWERLLASEVE